MVESNNMESQEKSIVDVVKDLLESRVFVYVEDGKLKTKAERSALTPHVVSLIKTHKFSLIEYLTAVAEQDNAAPLITASATKMTDPLSYSQQRLWLLDQIEGESSHYNMPHAIKLSGKLDYQAFERAFMTIMERHESLRTTFFLNEKNEPRQKLQSADNFKVFINDLSANAKDMQDSTVEKHVANEAVVPFDLSRDFLLRAQLLKLSDDEHILLMTMHHISSDGWSIGILINEFGTLYRAFAQGQDNPLPPLAIQYSDYACWQRSWLKGEELEKQLHYWENQLANLPIVHSLPLDFERPKAQTFNGKTFVTRIDSSTYRDFDGICKSKGASLFMGLHAAFSALLSRYSNETDIVVGTAIANREQEEISGLIGFFMNTLVLRSDLSEAPGFLDLIEQSKQMLLDAYSYQQVPFDQIVERLQPDRSLSHSALFQVMLVLQNNERKELELPALILSRVEMEANVAKFDLALNVAESADGLELFWAFNTDLFKEETIQNLAKCFEPLIRGFVSKPEKSIFEIDILSEEETYKQVVQYNDTGVRYRDEACIHELFEEHVEATPDSIALIFEDELLTYHNLNERANRVANYLVSQRGVKADTLVGVCLERSLEMVIAMLGILKAGGTYVPLDPNYPKVRLKYMIEDAGLETIVTQQSLCESASIDLQQGVCLDAEDVKQGLSFSPTENLPRGELTSSHLAYVIYTSGSTGQPKGVMIEHRNVVNFLFSMAVKPGIGPSDSLLAVTSTSFDIHGLEIFLPLITGAKTVVASSSQVRSPEDLIRLLSVQSISIMQATPSTWKMLLEAQWRPAAPIKALCGGEALSQALAEGLLALPELDLWNMYGPTETTIWSCVERIESPEYPIRIGKGINNTQLYVLAQGNVLAPLGTPGELSIGGDGLARGYLNRESLTQERFIENPFYQPNVPGSSKRLYKTGDLARYLADGSLACLGRIDEQIKLHGFRIELGEIELALNSHPAVKDAVVSLDESASGDKRLIAYVVEAQNENPIGQLETTTTETDNQATRGSSVSVDSLRQHLKRILPEYMLPGHFMVLGALPLTPNNKVDRKALPKLTFEDLQREYVAPNTDSERILCEICQELLEIERVGITDNFFALGGHSLLVVKLVSSVQKEHINLSVQNVFSAGTLRELAQLMDQNDGSVRHSQTVEESLIPQGCTYITPDMLSLVKLTQDDVTRIVDLIPGGARNIEDVYPVNPLQEGMLFHYTLDKEVDPFIASTIFRINDEVALNKLIDGLNFVISRYDILRTAVFWQGISEPVQVVCREAQLPVELIELEKNQDGLSFIQTLSTSSRRMDLGRAPLLELKVAKSSEDGSYFVLLLSHHMNLDNVGLELVQKELMYYFHGKQQQLPTVVPYREVIEQFKQQHENEGAQAFFKRQLQGIDEPTTPFGLVDIHGDGLGVDEVYHAIPQHMSSELRRIAKEINITPAVLFHVAWTLVVSACSGKEDIIFGTVVSGRMRNTIGVERMLGLFMNTLPLRVNIANLNITELVKQVQNALNELLFHEQTPLITAKRCSELPIDKPLFSALLNYRHSTRVPVSDEVGNIDLGIEVVSGLERANYPFSMIVNDFGDDFSLKVQVDNTLSASRIGHYMESALAEVLRSLSEVDSLPVSALSIIAESEINQLLALNKQQHDKSVDEGRLLEVFESWVNKTPDETAVITNHCSLSYSELNEKANRLAHYLIEMEVGENCRVGIFLKRSAETLIALLGTIKAGATYVPLETDLPIKRAKYIVEDSDIELVLLNAKEADNPAIARADVLLMDSAATDSKWLSEYSSANPDSDDVRYDPERLAYILYTSGSTGVPKGVMVPHRALQHYLNYAKYNYWHAGLAGSVVSSSLSFDATITTALTPLMSGGAVSIVSEGDSLSSALAEYFLDSRPWLFKVTPAHLDVVGYQMEQSARVSQATHQIIVGGEQLRVKTILKWQEEWLPQATFVNEYGPTETVVGCSTYKTKHGDSALFEGEAVPIGTAITNTELFVADKHCKLLPKGVAGELLIGGPCLSHGYVGNAQLTKRKFVSNPYYDKSNANSSESLYRTGDLVRWRNDDNLEFIGRIDEQVKIHGFRIELSEIEQQLLSHSQVNEAVVIALSNEDGSDRRLVAYVTHDKAELMNDEGERAQVLRIELIDSLRHELKQSLPEYMVPTAYVVLEHLPLTFNGKVDRKGLPAPDMSLQQMAYAPPTTETENLLCEIWQDVLGLEQVGISDNFFELGGHSLLLIKVIAKAQQSGMKINVQDFYTNGQLSVLASELDKKKNTHAPQFTVPDNLVPASCQQITPDMLPLVSLTQEEINYISGQIPGGVENIQDVYPLGPLQEGILYTYRLIDKNDPYILSSVYEMKDKTVLNEFIEAIQFIVDRHDVLRTAILWDGLPEPVQVVCKQGKLPVTWLEFDESTDTNSQIKEWLLPENQWMDLTQAPLIKLSIAKKTESDQFVVVLQHHHIVSDNVGLQIIKREVAQYCAGQAADLPPAVPYRNFIAHTLHQLHESDAQTYFTDLLGDVNEPTTPFGLVDIKDDVTPIVEVREAVPEEVASKIRELSKTLKVSPASLFYSAFGAVVALCSGRDNVVFGSVMSGRLQGIAGSEATLGVFINTLPMRLNTANTSVLDYVLSTQMSLRDLLPYEQAPLALTQSCSGLANDIPLINCMFNYRHATLIKNDLDIAEQNDEQSIKILGEQERDNYPLNMHVDDFGNRFELDLQIDVSVDAARFMAYMQKALMQLVECLDSSPNKQVSELSILPENELYQQLVEWNNTAAFYPEEQCIHWMFEEQVRNSPENTALVFQAREVSYGELNRKANQLAHMLVNDRGVNTDTLVGIYAERSIEMVVAILAVLKAGGAYVPIDPDYPESRINYMIEDARLSTVITHSHFGEQRALSSETVLCLDNAELTSKLALQSEENPVIEEMTSSQLAYVIYTSGSTGKPKGVMVEHQALVNRIDWMHKEYGCAADDRIIQKTPFSFDVSVWEFLWTLSTGAALIIAEPGGHKDPMYLSSLMKSERVTKAHFVPSMLSSIMSLGDLSQCDSLRQVFCSGEALSLNHVTKFESLCPDVELHNLYGPTEAAIDVCFWDCNQNKDKYDSVPIGRPIQNIQLQVVDSHLRNVPQGVAGELLIGGVGLARGYLNNVSLTAEKFVDATQFNNASMNKSARLYRTGDLVRWLPDGNLAFLGRIDHQVKIRGFRIELGEVEQALISHVSVQDVVVLAKTLSPDDEELVAYVVPASPEEEKETQSYTENLRDYLSTMLPDYMVPVIFVLLEALPLTPNGKVDRKSLPEPEQSGKRDNYVPPRTRAEQVLCELCQNLLGLERVGITDNFFVIGGNSLTMMRFVASSNELGISLSVGDVWKWKSIEKICENLDD